MPNCTSLPGDSASQSRISASSAAHHGVSTSSTMANNNTSSIDDLVSPLLPPTASSKLFGPRIPRLQNRCTLPRIKCSDGSRFFSQEPLELSSNPPVASARSEYDESDIDDIVSRYTTALPSSPPTSLQHRRAAALSYTRSLRFSSPHHGSVSVPISRALQRIDTCGNIAFSTPVYGSSLSPSRLRKYSSVSSLASSPSLGCSTAFGTPVSRAFLRHKRSSTTLLDGWAEAGNPLSPGASRLFRSSPLRDHWNKQIGSNPLLVTGLTAKKYMQSARSANKPSPDETTTLHARIPSPALVTQSHLEGQSNTVAEPPQCPSSGTSSAFSFVEPFSSPEPAIDILARAEGRKSADQEIKEIEAENFRDSLSATYPPSRHEQGFAPNPSHSDQEQPGVVAKRTQSLVLVDPREIFSYVPKSATGGPDGVSTRTCAAGQCPSFATVITTAKIRPKPSMTILSTSEPKKLSKQASVSSMKVRASFSRGLTFVAAVTIFRAWMLCALLRSIVRSVIAAEPVHLGSVVADLVLAMVLAVSTCFVFHLSLNGCAEETGVMMQHYLVARLPDADTYIGDKYHDRHVD